MKPIDNTGNNDMRVRLMNAAFNLFAEKGVDKVSVREIVEKVHASKPVLYYYFKDKEDLVDQLFRMHTEKFREMLESASSQDLPVEDVITQIFEHVVDHYKTNPNHCRFGMRIMVAAAENEKISRIMDDMMRSHHSMLHNALVKAQLKGEIPPEASDDLAHLIEAVLGHMSFIMSSQKIVQNMDNDLPRRMAHAIVRGAKAAALEPKKGHKK